MWGYREEGSKEGRHRETEPLKPCRDAALRILKYDPRFGHATASCAGLS